MIERNKYKANDTTPFDESKLQDLETIKRFLLHAMYGKDVRPAIAQLPDALISLFSKSGPLDNAELIAARGIFETLGIREDAQDNTLLKLQAMVKALASGSPKGTYPTLDALNKALPNGASGIYVTSDNGHWWYWNQEWKDGGVYQSARIPQEILDNISDLNRLKEAVRTEFNSGGIKETFEDTSYRLTGFSGDRIVEKTYYNDSLLYTRTTVIGGNVITSKITKGDA